ncbi:MAG: hypothetical protein H6585_09925 [Flavobacteriales bacterium]|nr:hypothetical protein [Flavobacteriales bacterium]
MASTKKKGKDTPLYKEKSFISHRFMLALKELKSRGVVRDYREFAQRYGYDTSTITNISNGLQVVNHSLLLGIVKDFKVNPDYLFGQSDKVFRKVPVRKIIID